MTMLSPWGFRFCANVIVIVVGAVLSTVFAAGFDDTYAACASATPTVTTSERSIAMAMPTNDSTPRMRAQARGGKTRHTKRNRCISGYPPQVGARTVAVIA